MTSFLLKMIALITMIIDHTGVIFEDVLSHRVYDTLRVIGRMSFIIYAFLISEGCRHTKNIKKYLFRLFVFAIIIELGFYLSTVVPAMIGLDNAMPLTDNRNIFFTLFLGAASCFGYDIIRKLEVQYKEVLSFIPFVFLCYSSYYFKTDYGYIGVSMIFLLYLTQNKYTKIIVLLTGVLLLYGSFSTLSSLQLLINGERLYFLMPFSASISVILIYFYNGKKGLNINKWFFYIAYPLHFVVLYLAKYFIGRA